METLQVEIINPKALKLLRGLVELNLISIKKTSRKNVSKESKNHKFKTREITEHETTATNEINRYKPQFIKYKGISYKLCEHLDCCVSIVDGQYMITNELLDVSVWGDTRNKAEEAFAFAFHALYENFATEDDINLTDNAKKLKGQLNYLVLNVVNNL